MPMNEPMERADLSPDERQERIVALLGAGRRLAVSDLARRFVTSEDSIRRDVRALASTGRIRRVHGAILPASPAPIAFAERDTELASEKARIAAAVQPFLGKGTVVLADGGTTVMTAMRALPADCRLTVVTPSIPLADQLAAHPAVEVVVIGGVLDRISRATVGSAAVEAVRAVRADVCLIAPCGLEASGGLTATGFEESLVKRAMVEASTDVIALATADKVGPSSRFHVAPAGAVSRLITGAGAEKGSLDALAALGVDILTV